MISSAAAGGGPLLEDAAISTAQQHRARRCRGSGKMHRRCSAGLIACAHTAACDNASSRRRGLSALEVRAEKRHETTSRMTPADGMVIAGGRRTHVAGGLLLHCVRGPQNRLTCGHWSGAAKPSSKNEVQKMEPKSGTQKVRPHNNLQTHSRERPYIVVLRMDGTFLS